MSKKKDSLPFDKRGGVIVLSRHLLNSAAYASLTPVQKVLMQLLHEQWRPDRDVAYSVREAAQKISCSVNTACLAFQCLMNKGFIVCTGLSEFNSQLGSKAREWRLTWMPFNSKPPTNDWEK